MKEGCLYSRLADLWICCGYKRSTSSRYTFFRQSILSINPHILLKLLQLFVQVCGGIMGNKGEPSTCTSFTRTKFVRRGAFPNSKYKFKFCIFLTTRGRFVHTRVLISRFFHGYQSLLVFLRYSWFGVLCSIAQYFFGIFFYRI